MPQSKNALVIPARVIDGDFAGWLREAMEARGMSSRMVELRTGLDHTTVYRLSLGERHPTLATAMILLQVLGEGGDEAPATTDGHSERGRSPDVSPL